MSTKVHYEVHVLEGTRWAFMSRYPGAEREEAIADARQTEIRTGRPTKVIRDTFYNELNYSEETVAYMSPNAKAKDMHAAPPSHRTRSARGPSSRSQRTYASASRKSLRAQRSASNVPPSPVSDGTFFVRLILVLVASIVIAAALTATLGFLLNALKNFGVIVPEPVSAQIAIYWYAGMFLLTAVALNRMYVPWHHLFSKIRRTAKVEEKAKTGNQFHEFTLKPKNPDPFKEAQAQQERLEVKMLRGDPDVTPDPYQVDDHDGEGLETETVRAQEDSGENNTVPPAAQTVSDDAAETGIEPADPAGQKASAGDSGAESDEPDKGDDTPETAAPSSSQQTPLTEMDTERLYMIGFLGDTVMTLRGLQDQMDADTRFGVSLYLAGAASILADRHGLTPDAEKAILEEALHLIGNPAETRNAFFENFEEHMADHKNEDIIHAGEVAMIKNLADTNSPSKGLDAVLQK